MAYEDFKVLNILSTINNTQDLIDFYLEHKLAISQRAFISKYASLLGSTEKCFSDMSNWYVNTYILPLLEHGNIDPRFKFVKKEGKFIESNLPRGCALLDVGCGPGRIPLTFYHNPNIKKILAFDLSAEMVKKAIELKARFAPLAKINFFRGDITSLPKLQLSKPVVITCMFGTLGNIPKYEDRIIALQNMCSSATATGKILLSVFNMNSLDETRDYYKSIADSWGNYLEVLDESREKTYFLFSKSGLFTTWYTKKGIKEELREGGLKNIHIDSYNEHFFISSSAKQ